MSLSKFPRRGLQRCGLQLWGSLLILSLSCFNGAEVVRAEGAAALSGAAKQAFSNTPSLSAESIDASLRSEDRSRPLELELGVGYENLTNGFSDWRNVYLRGDQRLHTGTVIYGELQATRRFDLDDQQLLLGTTVPLGTQQRWRVGVEGTFSPTHQVLPHWSLMGQVEHEVVKGWNLQVGFRHTQYDDARVNQESFTIENYTGDFRLAYVLRLSQVSNAGSGQSHSFQVDYYYRDRSHVGLWFSVGKEAEQLGRDRTLISNVQEITLLGQHWVSSRWGLTYRFTLHDQGDRYTRQGVQVGVCYQF